MSFSIIKKNNQREAVSAGLTTFEIHYVFIEKKIDREEFLIISDGGYAYNYSDFNSRYPLK